jgi:hypothetical protein
VQLNTREKRKSERQACCRICYGGEKRGEGTMRDWEEGRELMMEGEGKGKEHRSEGRLQAS